MKIGILAYCSACNFGAQLQLLSTYYYFKNRGVETIVIDWIPFDLDEKYSVNCKYDQLKLFESERIRLWNQSKRCYTAEEIAQVIEEEQITGMVIGSDAVLQHHSFLECVKFPTKNIIGKITPSSDTIFPNPFWGTFNDYLNDPIPIAVLSGSNQDSRFGYFSRKTRKEMHTRLQRMNYISVRDSWTQSMIAKITNKMIVPNVTPDPVFALNFNIGRLVPRKEEILKKFGLHTDYILFSFHDNYIVNQEWLDNIKSMADIDGIQCVKLPYADVSGFGKLNKEIDLPLSPIDWYALIKYSKGYIGQNMHPIVVALHNNVPFFSFDNYGLKKLNGLITDDTTSKILHILQLAKLDKYRISCINRLFKAPKSSEIYQLIKSFDTNQEAIFAQYYYNCYLQNMKNIEKALF